MTLHLKTEPLQIFKVASSTLQSLSNLAISYAQSIKYQNISSSISAQLPDISDWLDRVFAAQPHLPISSLLFDPTPEKLLAIFLPLLIFLFSMSTWGTRFWNSGRYSPFASASPVGASSPPTVSENDYDYLGPDDIDAPSEHIIDNSYHYPHQHNATRIDSTSSLDPDILVLKHLATTYPIHLPAFSIAEGTMKVGELRRLAARETKTDDPRRVKLFYKGRILKDDSRPCCDEGLKQQSVLRCVITEAGHHGRRDHVESSESADSEEMIESGLGGPRAEADAGSRESRSKRKGHRGGRRKNRVARDDNVETSNSNFLSPQDPYPAATRNYSPDPPRMSSPSQAHPSHPTTAQQKPFSPSRPKTSLEIIDALSHTFHSDLVPKSKHFLAHPPSDAKQRDMEYKRLSETILAQILLKLDAVTTDGDEGLRTRRRELVKEAQSTLNDLDRAGKAGR